MQSPQVGSGCDVKTSSMVVCSAGLINSISLVGSPGDDFITISPNITLPARIFPESGNDQVHSGSGNDAIYASDGDDYVYGGRGDDVITGDTKGVNYMS